MTSKKFVVVDLETTGLYAQMDKIIEIGMVEVDEDGLGNAFTTLIDPDCGVSSWILEYTNLKIKELNEAPKIGQAKAAFLDFTQEKNLVAHNATFDMSFLQAAFGESLEHHPTFCTMMLSRRFFPTEKSYKLEALVDSLGIKKHLAHSALGDASMAADLFLRCLKKLSEFCEPSPQNIYKICLEPPKTFRTFGVDIGIEKALNRQRKKLITMPKIVPFQTDSEFVPVTRCMTALPENLRKKINLKSSNEALKRASDTDIIPSTIIPVDIPEIDFSKLSGRIKDIDDKRLNSNHNETDQEQVATYSSSRILPNEKNPESVTVRSGISFTKSSNYRFLLVILLVALSSSLITLFSFSDSYFSRILVPASSHLVKSESKKPIKVPQSVLFYEKRTIPLPATDIFGNFHGYGMALAELLEQKQILKETMPYGDFSNFDEKEALYLTKLKFYGAKL